MTAPRYQINFPQVGPILTHGKIQNQWASTTHNIMLSVLRHIILDLVQDLLGKLLLGELTLLRYLSFILLQQSEQKAIGQ